MKYNNMMYISFMTDFNLVLICNHNLESSEVYVICATSNVHNFKDPIEQTLFECQIVKYSVLRLHYLLAYLWSFKSWEPHQKDATCWNCHYTKLKHISIMPQKYIEFSEVHCSRQTTQIGCRIGKGEKGARGSWLPVGPRATVTLF